MDRLTPALANPVSPQWVVIMTAAVISGCAFDADDSADGGECKTVGVLVMIYCVAAIALVVTTIEGLSRSFTVTQEICRTCILGHCKEASR